MHSLEYLFHIELKYTFNFIKILDKKCLWSNQCHYRIQGGRAHSTRAPPPNGRGPMIFYFQKLNLRLLLSMILI